MPGPVAALLPLSSSAGALGSAGGLGVSKIAAALGMLTAAGGGGFASSTPQTLQSLMNRVLTTATLNTQAVTEKAAKVVDDASSLRGRNPVIGLIRELLYEVAGGMIAVSLANWMKDLIFNEDSDKEVTEDTCRCGDAVEEINDACDSEIDAIGTTTAATVTAMLQALSAIDPSANPAAYKQGLEIIATYIDDASRIANECVSDRDTTMSQLIAALSEFVESHAALEFNECQPTDPATVPACHSDNSSGPQPTPVSATAPAASASPAAPAAPAAPVAAEAPAQIDKTGSGAHGNAATNTAPPKEPSSSPTTPASMSKDESPAKPLQPVADCSDDGEVQEKAPESSPVVSLEECNHEVESSDAEAENQTDVQVKPAAADANVESVVHNCTTMAASSSGVLGAASIAGVVAIVGMIGEEISKFLTHVANTVHASIADFFTEAVASQPNEAGGEPTMAPVVDMETHGDDCNETDPAPQEDNVVTKPVEPAPPTVEDKGFDKSALKPDAHTQHATSIGFDKSQLTGVPSPTSSAPAAPAVPAPEVPTVKVAPGEATRNSAGSSAEPDNSIHVVGEW